MFSDMTSQRCDGRTERPTKLRCWLAKQCKADFPRQGGFNRLKKVQRLSC